MRELTLRAVALGAVVGGAIGVANVYLGLKTGWIDGGSMTASLIGCAVLGRRGSGPLEVNIVQTTASAAAQMPAALGILGAFPALALAGQFDPSLVILGLGLALAVLGTLAALPLRRALVVEGELPFPTGQATATLLLTVHGEGTGGRGRSLALGALAAAVVTWLRDGWPTLLPQLVALPGTGIGLGVALSPTLLAAGALAGRRVALGLLCGGVMAWCWAAPAVVRAGLARPEYDSLVGWLLWPGVAIGTASALASLVRRAPRRRGGASLDAAERGVAPLALGAVLAVVALGVLGLGVHPAWLLGALLGAAPLLLASARAIGETDMNPVGLLGQLTLLVVGALGAAGRAAVVAAAIPSGMAAQTGQMLTSFKAGHRLGASVRRQILAQLAGVLAGGLCAVPAYQVLARAHGLGSGRLPAPAAQAWRAMAALVDQGASALPPYAGAAALGGLALGLVLAGIERTRVSAFVPSGVALGMGFLVPAHAAATMVLGALVLELATRLRPATVERHAITIASGGIVGESLTGVVVALLRSAPRA